MRGGGRIAIVLLATLLHGDARWPSTAPSAGPAADALASLTPQQAYGIAIGLMEDEKHVESLRYLRHALSKSQGKIWEVPYALFCALRNVTLAAREHRGLREPATRSSDERVLLVREALLYLDMAERIARKPRDIATIHRARGDLLVMWGLGWDGLFQYEQALDADSTWTETAGKAHDLRVVMRDPRSDVP